MVCFNSLLKYHGLKLSNAEQQLQTSSGTCTFSKEISFLSNKSRKSYNRTLNTKFKYKPSYHLGGDKSLRSRWFITATQKRLPIRAKGMKELGRRDKNAARHVPWINLNIRDAALFREIRWSPQNPYRKKNEKTGTYTRVINCAALCLWGYLLFESKHKAILMTAKEISTITKNPKYIKWSEKQKRRKYQSLQKIVTYTNNSNPRNISKHKEQ